MVQAVKTGGPAGAAKPARQQGLGVGKTNPVISVCGITQRIISSLLRPDHKAYPLANPGLLQFFACLTHPAQPSELP